MNHLPKYNAIIRQISTNLILSKQYQVKTEPSSDQNDRQKFKNDFKRQFKNFDFKAIKKIDFKIKNPSKIRQETEIQPINLKENLKNIIEQFSKNKDSFQNLIQPCQVMFISKIYFKEFFFICSK